MATKTWKIGEYAKGGVITVEITDDVVAIIGKDWDTSKGYTKKSDQSKAKEFTRIEVKPTEYNSHGQLDNFLADLTTVYYADIIMGWIESQVELTFRF